MFDADLEKYPWLEELTIITEEGFLLGFELETQLAHSEDNFVFSSLQHKKFHDWEMKRVDDFLSNLEKQFKNESEELEMFGKTDSKKKIKIFSDGKIVFSKAARADLYNFKHLDLYYDAEKQQIGIEPLDYYGSPDSFKIKRFTSCFITAREFFQHFKISILPGWYEYMVDNGMIVIQLPEREW